MSITCQNEAANSPNFPGLPALTVSSLCSDCWASPCLGLALHRTTQTEGKCPFKTSIIYTIIQSTPQGHVNLDTDILDI